MYFYFYCTLKLMVINWGAKERVIMLNAHMAKQKHKIFKTFKKMKTPSGPCNSDYNISRCFKVYRQIASFFKANYHVSTNDFSLS